MSTLDLTRLPSRQRQIGGAVLLIDAPVSTVVMAAPGLRQSADGNPEKYVPF